MLRSSNELLRYDVEAVDGAIGRVADFYFEDRDWRIRHISVDTDGMFGANVILYDTSNVRELKFPVESIVLDVSRASAEECGGRDMFRKQPDAVQSTTSQSDSSNKPLRSLKALEGFQVQATDRSIGDVHGLLVETATWSIRYLIVGTNEFLPGNYVLLSPLAIERVDWDDRLVKTDVTSEAMKNCPPYDPNAEVSRQYEAFLHDHYNWQKYWL